MQFDEPIRILSDLHFGHPASLIQDIDQIAPLIKGAPTVIFNGDTVEMRFLEDRPAAYENMERIGELCLSLGARAVFVNGNHDPIISAFNHFDLADGAILVTHGDMLFHDISPWSAEARFIGPAHTAALEEMEEDVFHNFEERLKASKRAALAVELHKSRLPSGRLARVATFARECWPPWRPLQIIRVWIISPARAVALGRVFRPQARFILIGHTHYGGIWKMGPRMIINTGSFLPFSGRSALELAGSTLSVYAIEKRMGKFQLGRVTDRFDVRKLKPSEGF